MTSIAPSWGQVVGVGDSIRNNSPMVVKTIEDTLSAASIHEESEHSPTKAMLWSIIPGAGQIYNGQAWKVPIVYGIIGTLGYFVYDNYTKMKSFKDEYLYRINNGTTNWSDHASYPNSSIYNLYQQYNKNFQLFIILTTVAYALNMVDAYVFGHLYSFQIDENISMNFSPVFTPNAYNIAGFSPSMQVSLRF